MKGFIIGGIDSVLNTCNHIQERGYVFLHVLWNFFPSLVLEATFCTETIVPSFPGGWL